MKTSRGSARSAVVAAAFVATYLLTHASAPAAVAPPPLGSLPFALPPWSGISAPPLEPDVARVLAADQYVRRYYQGPQGVVEMDLSYYTQPRVGTTMHSPLNCLPGNGWEVTSVNTRQLATRAGSFGVRELTVRRGTAGYALTYWFQSRHRVLADELATRFHLLSDALQRKPTDAGLVRVMMPTAGTGDAERATLAAFAAQLLPEIAARLN